MFLHESTCSHFFIKLLYRLMIFSLDPPSPDFNVSTRVHMYSFLNQTPLQIDDFEPRASDYSFQGSSQPSQPTQPAQNAENAEKCSLPCKNVERHQNHCKNHVKLHEHTKTYTKPINKCRTASNSL